MANVKLLEELCNLHGISGSEHAVRAFILSKISEHVSSVTVDAMGNIIAEKKGQNPAKTKLMLSAHMDEVGMMVTHITEDGLLKFDTVGGIDKRILCARQVVVGNDMLGVIGAKPIHLMKGDEREKAVAISDLYIDIGADTAEEAQSVVALGEPVHFVSEFSQQGNMIRGRGLDDRAGCGILIEMIQKEVAYDMTFVFCVQEEVGLRGARTATYQVNPEAALVLETTTAADITGVAEEKQVCFLGKGTVVSFMDKSTIYDKAYYKLVLETAEKAGLPCQVKQAVAGGNDAGAIHVSRGGVRTIALSLACRYLHGPMGQISKEDYHSMADLAILVANEIAGSNHI